jgi:formylglycine-generating enzyme required for sulfatase activity
VTGSTTIIRPEPDGDSDTLSTPTAAGSGVRLPQRLHGVDRESELADTVEAWRPAGSVGGRGPRFTLAGRLGQGSQGVVYALRDRDARRTVALKSLNGRVVDDEDIARFLHEVQVTAQLEHPGVVPVHDVGVLPDGTLFYTMKRVEGQVLSDWLVGRAGSVAHRFEVIQLFLKICDTMAFSHSRGVVHRDLKPRNIMVGTYGEVLVMDWGLAKVVGAAEPVLRTGSDVLLSAATDHDTIDGTAVGTPAYMSPEQARGQLELVDHRADIYGLGVLLYEMLAGASPYLRGDLRRTIQQVVDGQWTPIERQPGCQEMPRRLAAVVHKAMALRREDRYARVTDLAADLRAFLAGEAVQAYRETLVDTIARTVDRHRRPLAMAGAACVAVAALTGGFWWWRDRRDDLTVEALRAEIARAVSVGDWAAARKASEGVLVLRPDDREAQQAAVRFDERARGEAEALTRAATQAELSRRAQANAARLRSEAAARAAQGGIDGLTAAAELAKQAQALHPDNPELAADYERWIAELSRLRAERELAVAREGEIRLRRQSAAGFVERAAGAEAAGELDSAIGALRSAYELDPSPELLERLGSLIAQRRQRAAAEEARLREDEQRAAAARRTAEAERQLAEAEAALAALDPHRALGCVERAAALEPALPGLETTRRAVQAGLEAERRRQAEGVLSSAATAAGAAESLRGRIAELQDRVRGLRAELAEGGDPSRRAALAAAEDAMRGAERDRAASLAETVGLLNRALAQAPEHPPVRAALAAFWVERLREAEDQGDTAAAAAAEAQALAFDDGVHQDVLAGLARVANRGAVAVRLLPIQRTAERIEVPAGRPIELAAGATTQVRFGRYLAASGDGVRLALRLERGRTHELSLPSPPAAMPAGAVLVPGGVVRDERGRPAGQVAPFVMREREVTCGEWLEFINDSGVLARIDAAEQLILVPRSTAYDKEPLWQRRGGFLGRGGEFTLATADGPVDPATPVAHISHDDAVAYAEWRARRDRQPWRLPTVAEWQFAVQGGDGRAYPWGWADDLLLCASSAALARDAGLASGPGGRFPVDRSVQGVLDLAGSRAEFCAGQSPLGPDLRPLLGGGLRERVPERFTAWSRRDIDRRLVTPGWGVRLVYTP